MQRANGKSRSSPTLAAAFNLRQFSQKSGKGQLEPPRLCSDVIGDNEKHAAARRRVAEQQEAWRRREDEERGITRAREKEENLKLLTETAKRRAENARRKKIKEEHEAAHYRELRLQEERQKAENEEIRLREEAERARRKWEAEDAERRRRMPWACMNCETTGKCLSCKGKGQRTGVFLVSKLNHAEHPLEFGSAIQGCETCGGFTPGIRGKVEIGNGICTVCHGHGMIWPDLTQKPAVQTEKRASKFRTGSDTNEPVSPKSNRSASMDSFSGV